MSRPDDDRAAKSRKSRTRRSVRSGTAPRWTSERIRNGFAAGASPTLVSVKESFDRIPVGPTRVEHRAVREDQRILSLLERLDLLDPRHVDDAGAVDSEEAFRVESLLELRQRPAPEKGILASVETDERRAVGVDAIDLVLPEDVPGAGAVIAHRDSRIYPRALERSENRSIAAIHRRLCLGSKLLSSRVYSSAGVGQRRSEASVRIRLP